MEKSRLLPLHPLSPPAPPLPLPCTLKGRGHGSGCGSGSWGALVALQPLTPCFSSFPWLPRPQGRGPAPPHRSSFNPCSQGLFAKKTWRYQPQSQGRWVQGGVRLQSCSLILGRLRSRAGALLTLQKGLAGPRQGGSEPLGSGRNWGGLGGTGGLPQGGAPWGQRARVLAVLSGVRRALGQAEASRRVSGFGGCQLCSWGFTHQ